MTKHVSIFEQSHKGGVWRLLAVDHQGHQHCDFRRWYWDEEGVLKPTRDGLTFAIERLPELKAAVGDYLDGDTPINL